MITKSVLKFIKSLQLKKNRIEHQRFLVEGVKSVRELLNSDIEVDTIVATSDFIRENRNDFDPGLITEIKATDINAIGSFKNNNSVIAIAKIPMSLEVSISNDEYVLALDDVRDPGNLGTIIRIADWYGITQIIASPTTADFYNPKVISASMGSFARVKMQYVDLASKLESYQGEIYGALMDGISIHQQYFGSGGVIVMGNESVGISKEVESILTNRITIPKFGEAESLNVGIATAIICDRLRNS